MEASRRLLVLENQLTPNRAAAAAAGAQQHVTAAQGSQQLSPSNTTSSTEDQQQASGLQGLLQHTSEPYAVPLPEQQQPDAAWQVTRCTALGGDRLAPESPQLIAAFKPPNQHVRTLHDNWEASVAAHPNVPAVGWRSRGSGGQLGPYTWLTYAEVGDLRTALGCGLLQLGVPPGSMLGLYSVNCKEWVLLDTAAHAYSMVSVPLYDTLGPNAVQYICQHADLAVVGCSTTVLPKLLASLVQCSTVKLVVVWDTLLQQQQHLVPEVSEGLTSCRVVTLEQLASLGRRHPAPHIPPRPSDIATICYTSGTTGTPKGVVLSHANLIANAAGCVAVMEDERFVPGERHISYLPLAHIFERKNLIVAVHLGCSVGFYSGDVRALFDDVAALRPHMFMAVPRVYNRLHDAVMAGVRDSSPLQRRLFESAYAYKKAALEAGDRSGGWLSRVVDQLVFQPVRQRLGGSVRYMTTGASPISPQVLMFLRVCFGCPVLEGYGMTEAGCTISITRSSDPSVGHVGAPLPCCEVKLVDVPHMAYLTTDKPHPRGEVCVRGPTVFQGYHKDPAATAEVLDADGWLHTGDVGMWLPGGRLSLIDRRKNMFKLAQGEYVAPEKLEAVYTRSPLVLQAFVYGDSLHSRLVAVVVPDPETLLPWARQRNLGQQDLPALCQLAAVQQAVLQSMAEQGQAAQLQGFEAVAAVTLVPEPFSVESGLMTPTSKLRRHVARARYQAELDAMYSGMQQ